LGKADQSERRQQDADGEQPGLDAIVPGADAQPEMQPDAAVQPDDDQHQALPHSGLRPEQIEHIDIVVVDAEPEVDAAGADDVGREPERDQQAERDLRRLPGRHAQAATAPELVRDQANVAEQRGIEQQRTGQAAPDRDEGEAPLLHRGERDDAEGMVGQMARDENHQHQAGSQAQSGGEVGARTHRAYSR
jgi:hypothetical protein